MIACMSKQKKPPTDKPNDKSKDRGPVLYLRLTDEHEAALQAIIRRQRIRPDRTAVGLTALEEFFTKEGVWPPSDRTKSKP